MDQFDWCKNANIEVILDGSLSQQEPFISSIHTVHCQFVVEFGHLEDLTSLYFLVTETCLLLPAFKKC